MDSAVQALRKYVWSALKIGPASSGSASRYVEPGSVASRSWLMMNKLINVLELWLLEPLQSTLGSAGQETVVCLWQTQVQWISA